MGEYEIRRKKVEMVFSSSFATREKRKKKFGTLTIHLVVIDEFFKR